MLLASKFDRCVLNAILDTFLSEEFERLQRFQVIKPLPKTTAEQDAIAEEMFQGMVSREEDAVTRMRKVIEFATQEKCERPS